MASSYQISAVSGSKHVDQGSQTETRA